MAEKPSLGDDTTLQEQSSAPGQVPSADKPTAAHHKTTASADGPGPVVVHLGDAGVMPPGYRHPTVMPPVTISQSIDERNEAMTANEAVTLMKEAVDSAIKHGDIDLAAVAKAVGMPSRQHLREWIDSRIPNPQWDSKCAKWLQNVQRRAIKELPEP